MKSLSIVLSFFIVLQISSADEKTKPDVFFDPDAASLESIYQEETYPLGTEAERIQAGKERALLILSKAQKDEKTDQKFKKIFPKVENKLKETKILYPEQGYDYKACKEEVLAFVVPLRTWLPIKNVIHLCNRVAYGNHDAKYLAQILIHESAHLARYLNECSATRIEVAAMRGSGEGLAFSNGYMEECGIQ